MADAVSFAAKFKAPILAALKDRTQLPLLLQQVAEHIAAGIRFPSEDHKKDAIAEVTCHLLTIAPRARKSQFAYAWFRTAANREFWRLGAVDARETHAELPATENFHRPSRVAPCNPQTQSNRTILHELDHRIQRTAEALHGPANRQYLAGMLDGLQEFRLLVAREYLKIRTPHASYMGTRRITVDGD